ncbi:FMN-binding protein [Patulibacter sp. NPDC049589]|uniref:FMN-binding protein n=1 Tax=Patulibacter sp. NPDC049589 TaxID=3154731 RepID=UPI003434B881
MKRAPIVLSATVAGVAATLGFHTHAGTSPTASAAATPKVATATGAPTSTTASASTGTSTSTTSSPSTAATKQTAATASTKTVTSDPVSNQYGEVQLKVTVKNGKITDVEALQLPTNDPKSAEINAYAGPLLRQSTLTAQSADIDSVSGATYTSESYKTALQSVLDEVTLSSGATTS